MDSENLFDQEPPMSSSTKKPLLVWITQGIFCLFSISGVYDIIEELLSGTNPSISILSTCFYGLVIYGFETRHYISKLIAQFILFWIFATCSFFAFGLIATISEVDFDMISGIAFLLFVSVISLCSFTLMIILSTNKEVLTYFNKQLLK